MATPKKVTTKEFHDFVEQQLVHDLTRDEREAVKSAFKSSLEDVDFEEQRPFLGHPQAGLTQKEIDEGLAALRDRNSDFNKDSVAQIWKHPAKLDRVEQVLREAYEGNKEKHGLF